MTKLLAWVLSRQFVFLWLLRRAQKTPYSDITSPDGREIYMKRWWLFNPYHETPGLRRFAWFPWSVRIHHIRRPDEDRHLHDHPWNARTFILEGWYIEEREGRDQWPRIWRMRGDTAALRFGEYHRIIQVSNAGVYTLFVTGKYRGTWGFKVDGRKVPYPEYLGIPETASDRVVKSESN